MKKPIEVNSLGLINYDEALQLMEARHAAVVAGSAAECVFILQHPPVITKGRRLAGIAIPGEDEIHKRGIQICETDRGGQLTYHGPGQIVVYFVIKLAGRFGGPADLVHHIEKQIAAFFKQEFDLDCYADPDHPGLWCTGKKLVSIGLRIASGVSKHGIAINVANDESVYNLFDPCGMSGSSMTKLETILNKKIPPSEVLNIAERVGEFLILAI